MREEKQQQGGGIEDTAAPAVDVDLADRSTKFDTSGPIPPVAADTSGAAPPTASDRAYGSGASYSLLGFDGLGGSLGKPRVPTTHVPMTKEADLQALTARQDAERLLTSKGMDASASAAKALEILVTVPSANRGSVIDGLSDKAFGNLLDSISDDQRERFYQLVEVSQNPERKLKLWADAHKARATNNVARYKGDAGGPVPTYETEEENGTIGHEVDEEAEEELRSKLTPDQLRNRKRHVRREKAADTTREEVDDEVKALMAKAKKGQLTLKDVDDLRERKELEYKIELDSNVNLTSETPNEAGDNAHWKKDELEQVQRALPRVAQAQDPDGVEELHRVHSRGYGVGGEYHSTSNSIDVTDWASGPTPGYRHGGDNREVVSDEFKQKNGDKIGTMEFVVTHEIGHDFDAKHPKQFEAFQKAAGWERVKVDALRADGINDQQLVKLEDQRSNPNGKMSDVTGRTKIYTPIAGTKDEYWAVPITAIPAQDEAVPGSQGQDSWAYARVNPDEHFAEVYAKAVHVPEKLHLDLIIIPRDAASEARKLYEQMKHQVHSVEVDQRSPNRALKLANLKAILAELEANMKRLETARDQRAAEFAVMRNDVFGTDKAVKLSISRLKLKNVSDDKIEEFKQRAATVSTPEQVAYLEAEVSK